MADRKITELTALTAGSQATGDLLAIVDVSETASATKNKKITVENLFKGIPGNVGIGASSPGASLDVESTSDQTALRLRNTGGNNTRLLFSNKAAGLGEIFYQGDFRFVDDENSDTERLRINSFGNVGIGTTTPLRALTISKTGSVISGTGNSYGFSINPQTNGYVYLDAVTGGSNNTSLSLRTYNNGTYTQAIQSISGNETTFETAGTERMRIDSSGNVGIGTSSPTQKLSINGSLQFEANDGVTIGAKESLSVNLNSSGGQSNRVFQIKDNGTARVTFEQAGKVGIGTTSPGCQTGGIHAVHDATQGTPTFSGAEVGIFQRNYNGSQDCAVSIVSGTNASSTINFGDKDDVNPGIIEYMNGSNAMRFSTNAGERMRIDSSGRLLVGTTSVGNSAGDDLTIATTGSTGMTIRSGTSGNGNVFFADGTSGDAALDGFIQYQHANRALKLGTAATERMRIDSSGNVLIGKTSTGTGTDGVQLGAGGLSVFTRSNSYVALFNRENDNGQVIGILQDANTEGTISVSGSTVSYNGGHLSRWSQLAGNAERIEILRGSVLSNLDEMCEWGEENNEQLNRMKVSDVEGDVNASGVFQCWDDDDDTYTNDFFCAMTGDFVIRIAQGTTVARGDLLMSAGDGTAKPQDDDIVRSKTIAKVTSTTVSTTYADGSYCVPCVLMAC